jgi:hypothetical protein
MIVAISWRMTSQKKSGISVKSVKRVAKIGAKTAAKGATSALAVVASQLRPAPRAVKHARATLKSLPARTRRFVKRNPVRVLLGASAIGFVLAKLKRLV